MKVNVGHQLLLTPLNKCAANESESYSETWVCIRY